MTEFYRETTAELHPSRRHAKVHPAQHRRFARAAESVHIHYEAPVHPMTRQGAAA
jgi:hypothetical protein